MATNSVSRRKRALLARRHRRRIISKREFNRSLLKRKVGEFPEEEDRVKEFREWCSNVGIEIHPKVYIGCHGSSHGIGVVAMEKITSGETISRIPRSAILTSSTCNLKDLITGDNILMSSLQNSSSWVPLLIALIGEYSLQGSSYWQPYLNLVPNNRDSPPPMLWSETDRCKLLCGTGVDKLVHSDIIRLTRDYTTIVLPFLKRHSEHIAFYSQQFYNEVVSFVMTYSFTDHEAKDHLAQTMMVPFVDLLNHHSNHHVELMFRKKYLELVAIRTIHKGEEIMNTFGQLPNYSLLHTHGFIEKDVPFDKACVSVDYLKEVYVKSKHWNSDRWQYLLDNNMLDDVYEVSDRGVPEVDLIKAIMFLTDETRPKSYLSQFKLANLTYNQTKLLKSLIENCISHLPINTQTESQSEQRVSQLCFAHHKYFNTLLHKLSKISTNNNNNYRQ